MANRLAAVFAALSVIINFAEASHFRYGSISWKPSVASLQTTDGKVPCTREGMHLAAGATLPTGGCVEVQFEIRAAFRRDYWWGRFFNEKWAVSTSDNTVQPPASFQQPAVTTDNCNEALLQCFDRLPGATTAAVGLDKGSQLSTFVNYQLKFPAGMGGSNPTQPIPAAGQCASRFHRGGFVPGESEENLAMYPYANAVFTLDSAPPHRVRTVDGIAEAAAELTSLGSGRAGYHIPTGTAAVCEAPDGTSCSLWVDMPYNKLIGASLSDAKCAPWSEVFGFFYGDGTYNSDGVVMRVIGFSDNLDDLFIGNYLSAVSIASTMTHQYPDYHDKKAATPAITFPYIAYFTGGNRLRNLQNNLGGRYRLEVGVYMVPRDGTSVCEVSSVPAVGKCTTSRDKFANKSPTATQLPVMPVPYQDATVQSLVGDGTNLYATRGHARFQIAAFDQDVGDQVRYFLADEIEMGGLLTNRIYPSQVHPVYENWYYQQTCTNSQQCDVAQCALYGFSATPPEVNGTAATTTTCDPFASPPQYNTWNDDVNLPHYPPQISIDSQSGFVTWRTGLSPWESTSNFEITQNVGCGLSDTTFCPPASDGSPLSASEQACERCEINWIKWMAAGADNAGPTDSTSASYKEAVGIYGEYTVEQVQSQCANAATSCTVKAEPVKAGLYNLVVTVEERVEWLRLGPGGWEQRERGGNFDRITKSSEGQAKELANNEFYYNTWKGYNKVPLDFLLFLYPAMHYCSGSCDNSGADASLGDANSIPIPPKTQTVEAIDGLYGDEVSDTSTTARLCRICGGGGEYTDDTAATPTFVYYYEDLGRFDGSHVTRDGGVREPQVNELQDSKDDKLVTPLNCIPENTRDSVNDGVVIDQMDSNIMSFLADASTGLTSTNIDDNLDVYGTGSCKGYKCKDGAANCPIPWERTLATITNGNGETIMTPSDADGTYLFPWNPSTTDQTLAVADNDAASVQAASGLTDTQVKDRLAKSIVPYYGTAGGALDACKVNQMPFFTTEKTTPRGPTPTPGDEQDADDFDGAIYAGMFAPAQVTVNRGENVIFTLDAYDNDDCVELVIGDTGVYEAAVDNNGDFLYNAMILDEQVVSEQILADTSQKGHRKQRTFLWEFGAAAQRGIYALDDARPDTTLVCFYAFDKYLVTADPFHCVLIKLIVPSDISWCDEDVNGFVFNDADNSGWVTADDGSVWYGYLYEQVCLPLCVKKKKDNLNGCTSSVAGVPCNDLDIIRVYEEDPGVVPNSEAPSISAPSFLYPYDEINFPSEESQEFNPVGSKTDPRLMTWCFTPDVPEECVYTVCFQGYDKNIPEHRTTVRCMKVEVYNTVLHFDEPNQGFGSVPDLSKYIVPMDGLTMSAWVRPSCDATDTARNMTVMYFGSDRDEMTESGFGGHDNGLEVRNSIKWHEYANNSGAFFYYDCHIGEVFSAPNFCCNVWHYVAVVISEDNSARLYVDGTEPAHQLKSTRDLVKYSVTDFSTPSRPDNNMDGDGKGKFIVGCGSSDTSSNATCFEPWVGHIDEVRVWNRNLTESEILAKMYVRSLCDWRENGHCADEEPGLKGYWNMRTGTDSFVGLFNGPDGFPDQGTNFPDCKDGDTCHRYFSSHTSHGVPPYLWGAADTKAGNIDDSTVAVPLYDYSGTTMGMHRRVFQSSDPADRSPKTRDGWENIENLATAIPPMIPCVLGLQHSVGPTDGDCLTDIYGWNFADGFMPKCSFGNVETMASWVKGSVIRCETPGHFSPRFVDVIASNDGFNFTDPMSVGKSVKHLYMESAMYVDGVGGGAEADSVCLDIPTRAVTFGGWFCPKCGPPVPPPPPPPPPPPSPSPPPSPPPPPETTSSGAARDVDTEN